MKKTKIAVSILVFGCLVSSLTWAADPVKISIVNRVNADVVLENNPVLQEVERINNIKIDLEAPPISNYVSKLQIIMASGEMPDLIYNWGGADANLETWSKNGMLAQLDSKIGKYTNLMANISKEMWDAHRSLRDGKLYIIPRANVINHWGYLINQKWLDKLKMKAPTTLKEFTEVCRAFTRNDPDGNGKNDTFGVSFSNPLPGNITIWNSSSFITGAFNIGPIGVKDVDGKHKIREKLTGYLPYLRYIKQLVDEKIIDPEFLTNKVYIDSEKFEQNRVGIIKGNQTNVMGMMKTDPEAYQKYTYRAGLKNEKGLVHDYITPASWGGWMINAKSKKHRRNPEIFGLGKHS